MVSLASILNLGKLDVRKLLSRSSIQCICKSIRHRWRNGKLPPERTVYLMIQQMLAGNISCSAVRHLSHASEEDFTPEAYCQARKRLPLKLLCKLNEQLTAGIMQRCASASDGRWEGHRVFIVDGSSASVPENQALRDYFGLRKNQKPGCSYPTAHLLLRTGPGGVLTDAIASPFRTGDMTRLSETQDAIGKADLVLGDRLFCSWGHFLLLSMREAYGLFKAHHSRKILFGKSKEHGTSRRFLRKLGHRDQVVEYRKPQQRPQWMDEATYEQAPEWITVREVQVKVKLRQRVKVKSQGKADGGRHKGKRPRSSAKRGGRVMTRTITLVTTLLDAVKYPPGKLLEILGQRWTIETDLRQLKCTMGMSRLRCMSVEGVQKEVAAYLLAYNLVRLVMIQAAHLQGVMIRSISAADALAFVRYRCTRASLARLRVVPDRPGRSEPRVLKMRRRSFPVMQQPRDALREALAAKEAAA